MTGSAGQLEDGTLPRALPLTPGQSGPLRQMLCSPVQVRGPWLQAAGLCEQGTERPPKVNSVVAEERATENRTVISLSRKRKQDPSAFRGMAPGRQVQAEQQEVGKWGAGNVAGGE